MKFLSLFRRRSKFNDPVPTLLQRCEREAIQAAFARIDKERAKLAKRQNSNREIRK